MWSDSHLYQKSHWEPTSSWISQRLSSNTWLDYEKELHNIFVVFFRISYYEVPSTSYKGKPPHWKEIYFPLHIGGDGGGDRWDFSNCLENVICMKFSNPNQCVALCCVWKSSNWQKGWKSIVCSVDPIDLSGNVHPWKAQKDFSIGGIPSLSPGWLDVWNLKLN